MIEDKEKWAKEVCAGGVVYKKEKDSVFVLLANPRQPNFGSPQDYWTFPKGKIDEGETKEQAALREVREEGGVEAKIISKLGFVKYFRKGPPNKALKFVDYFLMEYVSGDPKDHDDEMADAKWVNIKDAENLLKFPTDMETFGKAREVISNL